MVALILLVAEVLKLERCVCVRGDLSISSPYNCSSGRYTFGRCGQLFTIAGTQPSYDFLVFV